MQVNVTVLAKQDLRWTKFFPCSAAAILGNDFTCTGLEYLETFLEWCYIGQNKYLTEWKYMAQLY